jgi:hypothetical protein
MFPVSFENMCVKPNSHSQSSKLVIGHATSEVPKRVSRTNEYAGRRRKREREEERKRERSQRATSAATPLSYNGSAPTLRTPPPPRKRDVGWVEGRWGGEGGGGGSGGGRGSERPKGAK